MKKTVPIFSIFLMILALMFIAFKILGYIDWEWMWVLAPIWIPLAIGAFIFIDILIVCLVLQVKEKE